MKLNEYIDVAELGRLVDDGLVSARRHPNPRIDLTVLNYTPKAVSSDWGKTLRRCRCLVYSDDLEIQHHGFEKFFNWGDPKTGLVLLGAIDRDGNEYTPECANHYVSTWLKDYKVVKEYDYENFETLQAKNLPNEEGYVATWYKSEGPAFRVKLKFEEYKKLHKLIFNTNSWSIWDLTREGRCVSLILEGATEEIKSWANKLSEQIQKDHDSLKNSYTGAFRSINTLVNGACFGIDVSEKERRKTFSFYTRPYAHPELLFSLYDGRMDKFEDQVWELVKPVKSFFRKTESEEEP